MLDAARFDLIRKNHGRYASWAVWAPPVGNLKSSNIGNLDVLDPGINPRLLEVLNPHVVMVGLNTSRQVPNEPFRNFHDGGRYAKDFKLRFLFQETAYWGAYMTDVIKEHVESDSKKVVVGLKAKPTDIRDNMKILREELRDLGEPKPLVLALGADAHDLLRKNLSAGEYSQLVRLRHYSCRESQEKYREAVERTTSAAEGARESPSGMA